MVLNHTYTRLYDTHIILYYIIYIYIHIANTYKYIERERDKESIYMYSHDYTVYIYIWDNLAWHTFSTKRLVDGPSYWWASEIR